MHLMCIYALLTNEQISFRNYNLSDIQLNRARITLVSVYIIPISIPLCLYLYIMHNHTYTRIP